MKNFGTQQTDSQQHMLSQ